MTNLPVPVPASESPGNLITGALWNANVFNGLTFTLGQPVFSGYQATAQAIITGTWTSLTLDTETLDSYGGHSTTTNPSQYIAQVPGTYLVIGNVGWAGNATGYRRARITKNGALIKGCGQSYMPTTTDVNSQNVAAIVALNGTTDYVEVQGAQNSGANLNTGANTDFCPSLSVFWICK